MRSSMEEGYDMVRVFFTTRGTLSHVSSSNITSIFLCEKNFQRTRKSELIYSDFRVNHNKMDLNGFIKNLASCKLSMEVLDPSGITSKQI
ncbi:hypothetical protein WDU94_001234 [Cyamophila willieti]